MARGFLINPVSGRRARQAKRRTRKSGKLTPWQRHVKKFKTRSGKLDLKAAAHAWKKTANKMSSGQARAMTKYRKRKPRGTRAGGRFKKGLRSGWTATRKAKRTRPKRKAKRNPRRKRKVARRKSRATAPKVRVRRRRKAAKARRKSRRKLKKGARTVARKKRRGARRRNATRRGKRKRNRVRRKRTRNPMVKRHYRRKAKRRRNPGRKRRRRSRNPLAALASLGLANPRRKRRGRRKRNAYRRRRRNRVRRRRNPAMGGVMRGFKQLVAKPALMDYAAVSGGFVVGGILPGYLGRVLEKVGIDVTSPLARAGVGIAGSLLAGLGAGMLTKKRDVGVKVAAGGLAGVIGVMVLEKVGGFLPGVSGLGADNDIRRAVEGEIKRQLGVDGMGQYLRAEDVAGVGDFGDYVTMPQVVEAPAAAGLGLESSEDIPDVDTFGDPGW